VHVPYSIGSERRRDGRLRLRQDGALIEVAQVARPAPIRIYSGDATTGLGTHGRKVRRRHCPHGRRFLTHLELATPGEDRDAGAEHQAAHLIRPSTHRARTPAVLDTDLEIRPEFPTRELCRGFR